MAEIPASHIGKYEVLTRLAVGGMAELFLAFVTGPGGFRKYVAVKRILPHLRANHEFLRMFLDEARVSEMMSHSNIAQVFDLGQDADSLHLVLEFIEGQDLAHVLRAAHEHQRHLPIGFSCAVVRDLCQALHYAHHFVSSSGTPQPVIHRDISPRNVMETYSGLTKVIDFGICKSRDSLEQTDVNRRKGSWGYMSPEQVRGTALDGRSDLFAAGVVLHELLTGQRLFTATEDATFIYKLLDAEITAPHLVSPEVPLEISKVVMKALSRERDARWADGKQMAEAIAAACGPTLFDSERRATLMRELFASQIKRTRHLLEVAAQEDTGRVVDAASELFAAHQSTPTVSYLAESRREEAVAAQTWAELHPCILAVDDSRVGRMLVESFLVPEGFRVVGAPSGAEALSILQELTPAMIVLDVRMPEMDGFELCKRIREQPHLAATPILFLSAACSVEERAQGLQVGADDFLRKPYENVELVARVKAHLMRQAVLKKSGSGPQRPGPVQK